MEIKVACNIFLIILNAILITIKNSWGFDNKELCIYALPVKEEILKEYGSTNLSYYEPTLYR